MVSVRENGWFRVRSPLLPRVEERTRMPRTRARLALHAADAKRRREARTGWRPQRDRACVVSRDVSRNRLSVFRHDASTTVRFPSRAPDSTHRAAPRARRLRMTRESVFESSRDSGFSDETTTVRGHEGHDVREDEKNEFSLKNITETLRTSPTRSRGATARGTPRTCCISCVASPARRRTCTPPVR